MQNPMKGAGTDTEPLMFGESYGERDQSQHQGVERERRFVHHLANTLHLASLPGTGVVDYAMPKEELAESAVRFLLRGLGLRGTAIDRYYDPKELKNILRRMARECP